MTVADIRRQFPQMAQLLCLARVKGLCGAA